MADKEQRPTARARSTVPTAPVLEDEAEAPLYGNAEAAAAVAKHTDLNSMRPGSASATAPLPDLSRLQRAGYQVEPIASMDVLYSNAKQNPDRPLSKQPVGKGGYDLVASGTFTTDYVQSAGPIMRDGKLDTPGHEKAERRGGVAVLADGTIVVGRGDGRNTQDIQKTFGRDDAAVKDFMGGGALLIENGKVVSDQDLRTTQRFDQGGGGIRAQQMRRTHHVLVGIRDGQAFVILANDKDGATMQKDLVGSGFDSVVKFDGGSGGYWRDGAGGADYAGTNTTGLGVRRRGK